MTDMGVLRELWKDYVSMSSLSFWDEEVGHITRSCFDKWWVACENVLKKQKFNLLQNPGEWNGAYK